MRWRVPEVSSSEFVFLWDYHQTTLLILDEWWVPLSVLDIVWRRYQVLTTRCIWSERRWYRAFNQSLFSIEFRLLHSFPSLSFKASCTFSSLISLHRFNWPMRRSETGCSLGTSSMFSVLSSSCPSMLSVVSPSMLQAMLPKVCLMFRACTNRDWYSTKRRHGGQQLTRHVNVSSS